MVGWEEIDPERKGITTAEALRILKEHPDDYQMLRDALSEFISTPAGELPSPKAVGNKLRHIRGRVVGGKALDSMPGRSGVTRWFVHSA